MSDPYGGKYATAGNPYMSADGQSFDSAGIYQQNYVTYYGREDAPLVWAEEANMNLINAGRAILTSQGVVSMDALRGQLQSSGYTGPSDIQSMRSGFDMLHTPKPASVPAPRSAPSGAAIGGLQVGSLPTPVLIGGGVLLLLLLGGRGRLL